jgi:hypothetical protein
MEKEEIDKYAKEQGYTKKDITNKKCLRCGNYVFKEKQENTRDKYPFYCAVCDENMFSFEVNV